MDRVTPKKSLGQNFLVDRNVAQKIVRGFDPAPGERIVEIGPGEGALTGLLLEAGARVTAVELDREAAAAIERRFAAAIADGMLEILPADILTVDHAALAAERGVERMRVIGNIPYYITSPILFHLIAQRSAIGDVVLMMQREVADRLVARERTKEYGILAVAMQTYATVERLFTVPPTCFVPRPKVTSAVVRLRFRETTGVEGIEEEHRAIVRNAFGQRRKTLNNALSGLLSDGEERSTIFAAAKIDPGRRAEELTRDEFAHLAGVFAAARARQRG